MALSKTSTLFIAGGFSALAGGIAFQSINAQLEQHRMVEAYKADMAPHIRATSGETYSRDLVKVWFTIQAAEPVTAQEVMTLRNEAALVFGAKKWEELVNDRAALGNEIIEHASKKLNRKLSSDTFAFHPAI